MRPRHFVVVCELTSIHDDILSRCTGVLEVCTCGPGRNLYGPGRAAIFLPVASPVVKDIRYMVSLKVSPTHWMFHRPTGSVMLSVGNGGWIGVKEEMCELQGQLAEGG